MQEVDAKSETVLLVTVTFFGNVNTVKEFSEIFVVDVCHLVNLGTCHCNSISIVAFYPDFFFLVGAVKNSDAGWRGDASFLALAHEVGEAELVLAVADGVLDGEVGGYEAHFVAVAFGDSGNHVLDVAKERATMSNELAVAGPGAS